MNASPTNKMAVKPPFSFWQIVNMSIGFLGIQFGFALQAGNASRILQTFGADVEHLTWFWLAAPLTGMIIQPIIGHYSDSTWTRLGRRTPYFLTGAILSSIALFFMPNASLLAALLAPVLIGAGILMIMDASFNVAMEPFRALIADNLPQEQHNKGFSIQTALIGLGAILGSLLPYVMGNWFRVDKTAEDGIVPNNLVFSFYLGGVVLLLSVFWTIFKTKEYPPEVYSSFHPDNLKAPKSNSLLRELFENLTRMPKTMRQLAVVQFFTWFAFFSMWVFTTPAIATHVFHVPKGDTTSIIYNNAANWVGILFGVYNAVSALYAISLPFLINKVGRRPIHAISLAAGGLGLISLFFIQNQDLLILPMIGIGLAWGSALAIPYAILSSSIPPSKIGVYMGVFNFTITFPQILNGLIGGLIVEHLFNEKTIYALVMAGVFLIIASIFVFKVDETVEPNLISKPSN